MVYRLRGMKFRMKLLPTVILHVLGTGMVSFAISVEEKSKILWFLPLASLPFLASYDSSSSFLLLAMTLPPPFLHWP